MLTARYLRPQTPSLNALISLFIHQFMYAYPISPISPPSALHIHLITHPRRDSPLIQVLLNPRHLRITRRILQQLRDSLALFRR